MFALTYCASVLIVFVIAAFIFVRCSQKGN